MSQAVCLQTLQCNFFWRCRWRRSRWRPTVLYGPQSVWLSRDSTFATAHSLWMLKLNPWRFHQISFERFPILIGRFMLLRCPSCHFAHFKDSSLYKTRWFVMLFTNSSVRSGPYAALKRKETEMSLRAAGKQHAGTQGAKNGRLQESDWAAVMLQVVALSAALSALQSTPAQLHRPMSSTKAHTKYHFKSSFN